MKFALITSAAALIAGVIAQSLPTCGMTALATAYRDSGCSQNDAQCLCSSPQIRSTLEGIGGSCPNESDRQAYEDFYNQKCASEPKFSPLTIN